MESIKYYLFLQYEKLSFQLVLGIISVLTFWELLGNIIKYKGCDVTGMYQMVRLLLLSSESVIGKGFILLFPVIVALPAGFSYLDDTTSGMDRYLISKTGLKRYQYSKLIAGGIAGFTAFFIPLAIELFIGCLAFPLKATGNIMGLSATQEGYIEEVKTYLYYPLYLKNPVLYYFLAILAISSIAGLLNIFTISLSMMIRIKYRILLIVPSYIMLFCTRLVKNIFNLNFETGYDTYLQVFGFYHRCGAAYLAMFFLLFLISFTTSVWGCRNFDK